MNTFTLTVATPDGNRFQGEVIGLFVRGAEGDHGRRDFLVRRSHPKVGEHGAAPLGHTDGLSALDVVALLHAGGCQKFRGENGPLTADAAQYDVRHLVTPPMHFFGQTWLHRPQPVQVPGSIST